jgi:hypothetical protein
LPAGDLTLIVSAVSADSFLIADFRAFDSPSTGVGDFTIEPELAGGCAGVKTNGFWQVGHGTVCPVPSTGYSMDCPQCGHAHFRKLFMDSFDAPAIQTPFAPFVHPKLPLAGSLPTATLAHGHHPPERGSMSRSSVELSSRHPPSRAVSLCPAAAGHRPALR